MRPFLPLLLFLSACSGPSEYRFPPAHPTPVYTPPGTGLPMPSSPGPGVRNVPRSPNRRVLPPPGKEKGLWSADRPRASSESGPVLIGLQLPLPEDATADVREKAAYCANGMEKAIDTSGRRKTVKDLAPDAQWCLAAKLYHACIQSVMGVLTKPASEGRPVTDPDMRDLHALGHAALVAKDVACADVPKEPTNGLAIEIGTQWLHDEAAQ